MPEWRNRRITYNTTGHIHELTFSCYKRLPLLTQDYVRRAFLQRLNESREKYNYEVWAYVLMPEHVHLLLCPCQAEYDIDQVRRDLKQRTAFASLAWMRDNWPDMIRKLTTVEGSQKRTRFWQDGKGYDRNLFDPDAIWSSIEYMHANPVKRGLCVSSLDWPWSSARSHEGVTPVEFEVDSCTASPPTRNLY